MLRLLALTCLTCALHLTPAVAQLEEDVGVQGSTEVSGAMDPTTASKWWLGGYWRHLWIPPYMTEPFFDRAPSVVNNGFGLAATYRTDDSLNVQFGVGFMPYEFRGTFLADGNDLEDTELVDSDLEFLHLTGSLLWDIEFHHTIALEIGVGLDIGVLLGEMRRNEAFLDATSGTFQDCVRAGVPDEVGPNLKPYCDVPQNGQATDPADREGEHYDVEEDRVPPVMLFPMVPQVALRVQPFKHLVIKAEFGFGVVQMWAGLSLHASFGLFEAGPSEVFIAPDDEAAVMGRVLGKVVEAGTDAPIAGATVSVQARALSPLSTLDDGRFVVDRLDAGSVRFEVQHPEYAPGNCQVEIPPTGGDAAVTCYLTPKARVGAISGQIKDDTGGPVSVAIDVTGPRNHTLTSDETGVFASVDLPAGTYRLRVDAEGFLLQVVEVEVEAHETAMPQIILLPKPKKSLVKLKKKEIVITQQINFKSSSAEILGNSEPLMREIADVMLRNPHIELVEIQGHTDPTGPRSFNMKLSQNRAESVVRWLVGAGVEESRMQAKGYGPDHPIRPNNTPGNRAKNRRVQFIIRRQSVTME